MSVFNGCDSHKKSNHTNFIRNTVMTRMLEAQQQHVNVNKVYQESDVIPFQYRINLQPTQIVIKGCHSHNKLPYSFFSKCSFNPLTKENISYYSGHSHRRLFAFTLKV